MSNKIEKKISIIVGGEGGVTPTWKFPSRFTFFNLKPSLRDNIHGVIILLGKLQFTTQIVVVQFECSDNIIMFSRLPALVTKGTEGLSALVTRRYLSLAAPG